MIGTYNNVQILSGPLQQCPSCQSYMYQTYKRKTVHICGIPFLPAGRKYRIRCFTCGLRQKPSYSMPGYHGSSWFGNGIFSRRAHYRAPYSTMTVRYPHGSYFGRTW